MGQLTEIITAHGGGGTATQELLDEVILPPLRNEMLNPLDDSAVLARPDGRICFTTDGYVVKPIIFPGGTIGDLAICGTVNDLAVMGATPMAVSLGLIIDEGLKISTLRQVMDSIANAAKTAGVSVVTGDTKVIETRGEPGMTITTSGLGIIPDGVDWHSNRIAAGDVLLINGGIAEHGMAVMAKRENLQFSAALKSDVAPLNELLAQLRDQKIAVKFARDCTRAGLAGVVADIASSRRLSVAVEEKAVPLSPAARHTAELLGLDPLNVANEGKVVVVVDAAHAERALKCMVSHQFGRQAAIIGSISETQPPLAELITRTGGRRIIQKPYGEDLPRIC